MAASSYDEALKGVLAHEGGNDDDPRDPGGRTSRGILQSEWSAWRQTHPGLPADVWKAPQDQVEAIYKQKYWDALRCDDLPAGVDYAVFDYGVNSGIGRAGKVLRRVLGLSGSMIAQDMIAAAQRADAKKVINEICDERLAFLQSLSTWKTFGRGWSTRVKDVRAASLAMASKSSDQPPDLIRGRGGPAPIELSIADKSPPKIKQPAPAPKAPGSSPGVAPPPKSIPKVPAQAGKPQVAPTRPPWRVFLDLLRRRLPK
jgi:lysozyme family protein